MPTCVGPPGAECPYEAKSKQHEIGFGDVLPSMYESSEKILTRFMI